MGDLKLFIQGGKGTYQAQVVEILGENKRIDGGIYIRYASGGSDTTTADHLTDIPEGFMGDSVSIENGDTVYYERCFGDSRLIFVGMAEGMEYHDCVLIHKGMPCGAEFRDVVLAEKKALKL